MKDIDADYYGYRDEDDGRIIPAEQEVEKTGASHIKTLKKFSFQCSKGVYASQPRLTFLFNKMLIRSIFI